jgi:putative phosphoesterase
MIGIISDTHDNVGNILKAVKIFQEREVDFVIHLGDVVSPGSILFFKGVKLKVIKGNCDGDIEGMKLKLTEIGGQFLGDEAFFEISGKKIAAIHGDNLDRLNRLINTREYSYVLHGHTHLKKDQMVGTARVINPGAHYWGSEMTIALIDPLMDRFEFVRLPD